MSWRRPTLLILLLLAAPQRAAAQEVAAAIRAGEWAAAEALAAQSADPVALKLVTFFRMLAPGAATATELADFIAQSPDWPDQAALAHRRDQALAAEPDDSVAARLCAQATPRLPAALARCAAAVATAGQTDAATAAARAAWTGGLDGAGAEAAFLQRWSGALTAEDERRRFDQLSWAGASGAAVRQLARLDPAARADAEARLALRRDDPAAEARYLALPAASRRAPALLLDYAIWLRHAGREADALALWRADGAAAQRRAPAERLAAFWAERNLLARHRLRDGDAAGAYLLADQHGQQAGEALLDAEFLAGFIALRKLNDPAAAARHFQALAQASQSAITQGRAQYWLGRAAAAAGADPKPDYAAAAAYPTTFYGQLAALALGDDPAALNRRIAALRDPGWDRARVLDFAGREVTRAAATLVAWGEPRRARAFLLRLEELSPDAPDRSLAARLALGFGLPDEAVAVARFAGRDGLMLPDSGWPMPVDPPAGAVEPAVTLGLIRQESSFDAQAVSPSGARGLMQLMPATAQAVARQVGAPVMLAALTTDTAYNMRLGTAYLRQVLDQFDNSLPLALAAYNAGPNRVQQWLAENGDPRIGAPGQPDMIDWIELIGFGETRNYVQRVIENVVIYRAKRGEALAHPLAPLPPPQTAR